MAEEKEGPRVLWSRMVHGIHPKNFRKVFLSGSRAVFKTIQGIKQKVQVTLYPSRQVREVPRLAQSQPSACPVTGMRREEEGSRNRVKSAHSNTSQPSASLWKQS